MKTTNNEVTFAEVPDEIALCINISGCPIHCKGCHSTFLWEDVGEPLTLTLVCKLIDNNPGVSCICFMGGIQDPQYIISLTKAIRELYDIKIAWYVGVSLFKLLKYHKEFYLFDYLKVGAYKEKRGPLTSERTNQRFYKVEGKHLWNLKDITYKFWKNDSRNNYSTSKSS